MAAEMFRSLLVVGSGTALAWVAVDVLWSYLRLGDAYAQLFLH